MKQLSAALLMLAATAAPAYAQLEPGRPIRIIVGYGAGSALEVPIRAIMDSLQQRLGSPIFIENRPGAGGVVGSEFVARATPDGHTLVMAGAGSHGVTAARKNLPFNLEKDFTPISRVADFPVMMLMTPKLQVQNLQEMIAYARARPGQLNFGSSGIGTSLHLTGELLKQREKLDITHVPYRGAAAVATALIAGEIQLAFDGLPAVKGLIESGQIKALAVTASARIPEVPTIPTTAEAGLQDFVVTSWTGPFGPPNMSKATVDQLAKAFTEAAMSADGQAKLRQVGTIPVGQGPEEFDKFWRADMARWKEVVRVGNIPMEE